RSAHDRAVDEKARRQDGLLRPLRHRSSLHCGLGGGHRSNALGEVPVLERRRSDLLGDAGRAHRLLRRWGGGGRDPALRALCRDRDRRRDRDRVLLHARRQEVAGESALARRLALALVLVVSGCAGGSSGATIPATVPHSVRVPGFSHVVVVVFETHEATSIAGSPAAPTFNALARRYAALTSYTAIAHPSLPNYLALVSGSTHGISSDCTDCVVQARNLADTLA